MSDALDELAEGCWHWDELGGTWILDREKLAGKAKYKLRYIEEKLRGYEDLLTLQKQLKSIIADAEALVVPP